MQKFDLYHLKRVYGTDLRQTQLCFHFLILTIFLAHILKCLSSNPIPIFRIIPVPSKLILHSCKLQTNLSFLKKVCQFKKFGSFLMVFRYSKEFQVLIYHSNQRPKGKFIIFLKYNLNEYRRNKFKLLLFCTDLLF